MGRKTILAAVCWLTLSQVLCDKNSQSVADNVSAESAPRLYGNVPVGVYASAAPYAAYSFHLPQFVAAPKTAASQVAAVKQKPVNQNINTYLMDSYGNRYFETPQQLPYKSAFSQQYVSLQPTLPEHLAQPLVAASPNFQFQQSGPQVFFGAPIRVSSLQTPTPTPLNQFPSFGRLVYADKVQSLAPSSISHNYGFKIPTAQQQSSNNKAVFSNTESHEQHGNLKDEPKFQRQQQIPQIIVGKPKSENKQATSPATASETKFQRIHEIPKEVRGHTQFQRLQEHPGAAKEHTSEGAQESSTHQGGNPHSHNAQIQSAPTKQATFTYVNDINGKKSVVKVQSEPIPLLDLTLLEPLTFKNPLVPQVQHFLPRINQATYTKLPQANLDGVKNYQKEFMIQKTMSYDSRNANEKPQKNVKKEKKPTNKHNKKNNAPKKTHHETLDEAPEIVYEINGPGHKETIIEKAISYNKETQPEPVHYSYGSKTENEPVTYSYSRSSKDPGQLKQVRYYGNGQGPSQLIYNFKPEELHEEEHVHKNVPNSESNSHEDSAQQSEDYKDHPKSSEEYDEVPHKEQNHYRRPSQPSNDEPQEHRSNADSSHYNNGPIQQKEHYNVDPVVQEYEEDIRLLANAQIKVDPTQHVPHADSEHHARAPQQEQESEAPHQHHHSSPQKQSHHHYSSPQSESQNAPSPHNNGELNHHHLPSPQKQPHSSPPPQSHIHFSSPQHESHNAPAAHIHEKSKRIIIHDETPDGRHMHQEQMKAEVFDREENNEEDFEKAYKNAAFGFPAYSKEALEAEEKDIFDPESYGVPPDHVEYNIENTPFQQYQEEGDEFPKEARARYKDSRDKMKEGYYTDYSISKPESLLDRYQNKLGYYKLYKQQKPDYYVADGDDDDKKKQKQKFAQYSVAPTFGYNSKNEEKAKSYYGHQKPKQQLYEYDYSEGKPRDNSAFASRPYQRYRTKTNFVEPQFQYGFEPISIPKLLDSELAAMASVHRPESEKPGMRKKVYKENWYIKKTSTAGGVPAS
ncbi:uncharacterized protein LOC118270885 [Spodoptera frugiperda]|uniref:Uncharacterized protein LOC118270885 n=1 Tax=Spodoptera frugiperda TaxID=7108 RepID=A0A9R0EKZ3_SPOFR|nr:uncharacterized protein LOC118270885 [Spodoptera frugiperda]